MCPPVRGPRALLEYWSVDVREENATAGPGQAQIMLIPLGSLPAESTLYLAMAAFDEDGREAASRLGSRADDGLTQSPLVPLDAAPRRADIPLDREDATWPHPCHCGDGR